MADTSKYTNALINESSLYLKQHAHNPVNWVPFSHEVFELAKKENKLILFSIGYSACHWCHVMEHESFEDEIVAQVMNEHFINVKVDREERPDVDQVYMSAVQLMTNHGGWPLNCFTLPDGRPIYGGTYFPKEQWMHILKSLVHLMENNPEKAAEYAEKLHDGVKHSELIAVKNHHDFHSDKVLELVNRWRTRFDLEEGGSKGAPKFPMPNNWEFLLHYSTRFDDPKTFDFVELTLKKMALSGIYDHVGGGIMRYSVDDIWRVPHFEKMLYDNAQMLSVMSQFYKVQPAPWAKRFIQRTIEWLTMEMHSTHGGYYAAMDADSEGDEGKYYSWSPEQVQDCLKEASELFIDYFGLNENAVWEHGKYILQPSVTFEDYAQLKNRDILSVESSINRSLNTLRTERKNRVAPGTDTKCITSWNGLLISGFCQAAMALQDSSIQERALELGKWIIQTQWKEDHLLRIQTDGASKINGFLDDYCFSTGAFLDLYELTLDDYWLNKAIELQQVTDSLFFDTNSGMYFYTESNTNLIARKMEINDNVIPSSNSSVANNLFRLGQLTSNHDWIYRSKQMLMNVYDGMEQYGSGYSNWGHLLIRFTTPFFTVGLFGQIAEARQFLHKHYLPHVSLFSSSQAIPAAEHKSETETKFYVCSEGTCLLPTDSTAEVMKSIS